MHLYLCSHRVCQRSRGGLSCSCASELGMGQLCCGHCICYCWCRGQREESSCGEILPLVYCIFINKPYRVHFHFYVTRKGFNYILAFSDFKLNSNSFSPLLRFICICLTLIFTNYQVYIASLCVKKQPLVTCAQDPAWYFRCAKVCTGLQLAVKMNVNSLMFSNSPEHNTFFPVFTFIPPAPDTSGQ